VARRDHYFDLPAAHEDDALLREHIAQGKVPPGCLLSGVRVGGAVALGRDPCGDCDGPRMRCGGRPRTDGGGGHTWEPGENDGPAYRREQRKQAVSALRALLEGE